MTSTPPPALEVRSLDLRDGQRLVVRHAQLDDVTAVQALYERLSPDDVQLRFFSGHPPMQRTVQYWVSSGDRGGVVLVAEVLSDGTEPTVVAEAGYALLADGDGELAITVDPEWRGWLGPWLLDILTEQAADRGVTNLEADVLVRNRKMRSLLAHRGYAAVDHPDYRQVRLVINTAGRTPSWPPHESGPRILATVSGARWNAEEQAQAAGFDVRTCPGPNGPHAHCPALEGRPCPLVEGADALVISLPADDPQTKRLVAAHHQRHPELPIIVLQSADRSQTSHPCEAVSAILHQIQDQLATGTDASGDS